MLTILHRYFSKTLARNLRNPKGIMGNITANMMNSTNLAMTKTALQQLDVQKNDCVIDIGFGGGLTFEYLLEKGHRGHVAGLEISDDMLARAGKAFQHALDNEKLSLHKGSIEALPFIDNNFDKICTLNTIYFWQEPKLAMAELYRVCRPQGRVVIAYRQRQTMQSLKFTRHGFTLYQNSEVSDLLHTAGFSHISSQDHMDDEIGYTCITAHKDRIDNEFK